VTRKEIVRSIAEDVGLTQVKTKEIVQKVFDVIVQTLLEEGRVELRNFGVFEVKRRGPRKARNPRTGEKVDVPEKSVVTFKPGQIMQQRVEALGHCDDAAKGAGPAKSARASSSAAETPSGEG
jgi:integration host factor subunit beta